jgi:valyl-tRNA synthetase
VGRRLATKLLNASRFVLGFGEPEPGATVTETLDQAMLAALDEVTAKATAALRDFDYTTALESTERFFWSFCDDYLELVKQRAYDDGGGAAAQSARLSLRSALSVLLRLFAPVLPFCAEEAWSWWHDDSVHTNPWPAPATTGRAAGTGLITMAATVIGAIRKAKSEARQSMRAPVRTVRVQGPASQLESLRPVIADITAAGNVGTFVLKPGGEPELQIDVLLEA